MRLLKILLVSLCFLVQGISLCRAEKQQTSQFPFQGRVNSNNINIRSDSTSNSQIICQAKKGQVLQVSEELYDWYKVSLPYHAPCYIRDDFVLVLNPKESGNPPLKTPFLTARVTSDNVNIRLSPDTGSAIIGKVNKGELLNVLKELKGWLKIEPNQNCFGWIHKKFVDKVENKSVNK